jgi:hypothetical protein
MSDFINSLAGLITAIATLLSGVATVIASIAAYRKAGKSKSDPTTKAVQWKRWIGSAGAGGVLLLAISVSLFSVRMDLDRPPAASAPIQQSPALPSSSSPECKAAKITAPFAARDRESARKFEVSREFALSWNPPGCLMIIQYFQNNQLIREIRPAVISGTSLTITNPGETEIKIWYESASGSVIADNRWIWVK